MHQDQLNTAAVEGHHLISDGSLPIALPDPKLALSQDEEWCMVRLDDDWRKIRFHDYADIYEIEGLYERLFRDVLGCRSPEMIAGLLEKQVEKNGTPFDSLRILDLGAGNGMVGEALSNAGARKIVGVDIIEAAKDAVSRDRPGMYSKYHVADMTELAPELKNELKANRFNCLTCVAALGFGDIPVRVFVEAYNLIEAEGLIAFNIKEEFLNPGSGSDFSDLVGAMIDRGDMVVEAKARYVHRNSTRGLPLHYVAFVGRKRRDLVDPS